MKSASPASTLPVRPAAAPASADAPDQRTRDRVLSLLREGGPATARTLADELGIVPAAVRRHLDLLLGQGKITEHVTAAPGERGRGRPARRFALTDLGRSSFGHTYDDLAAQALRHLARHGGPEAVARFAAEQVQGLEEHCEQALADANDDPVARTEALAAALSAEGYAASASAIAAGGQVCQHHCPVAHVAKEFPQLCEAETAAISRLVGSHVQRLATIANGDGVCTTYIPGAQPRGDVAGTCGRPPYSRSTSAGSSTTPADVPPEESPHRPRTSRTAPAWRRNA